MEGAGSTVVDLRSPGEPGCVKYGPKPKDCYRPPGEIGPAILRPDGTVFATGAGTGPSGYGTGHTAIYNTKNGTWAAGPDFPNNDNAGDSYAMLEPSGNVLVLSIHYILYEYNGKSFAQVGSAAGPPLLLPTGQVLMLGASGVVLYTPKGKPQAGWAPTITAAPAGITPGKTYKITGTQFNGLSQAVAFGDEEQNATGYPLVRITNDASGKVCYARTHDHSTMASPPGRKKSGPTLTCRRRSRAAKARSWSSPTASPRNRSALPWGMTLGEKCYSVPAAATRPRVLPNLLRWCRGV